MTGRVTIPTDTDVVPETLLQKKEGYMIEVQEKGRCY
jgi:hypothetical protein